MSVLPHTRCIVLIPAGPATVREYLNDTIESAIHYIGSNCTVAVIDDSREDRFAYVANVFRNAVVMKAIDCDEGKHSLRSRCTRSSGYAASTVSTSCCGWTLMRS